MATMWIGFVDPDGKAIPGNRIPRIDASTIVWSVQPSLKDNSVRFINTSSHSVRVKKKSVFAGLAFFKDKHDGEAWTTAYDVRGGITNVSRDDNIKIWPGDLILNHKFT